MKVLTACNEPHRRSSNVEAAVQFLAENSDMVALARLMAHGGEAAPVDMHACTATLQIARASTPLAAPHRRRPPSAQPVIAGRLADLQLVRAADGVSLVQNQQLLFAWDLAAMLG